MKNKKYLVLGVVCVILAILIANVIGHMTKNSSVGVEAQIRDVLEKSGVPDAEIVVVDRQDVEYSTYGKHADDIEEETLFELGSMSKAFTALAILKLEDDGLIQLTDSIDQYVPWLTFVYHGTYDGNKYDGEVPMKISNFLYQTSGIPYETVGDIPIGDTKDMLEGTIRNLAGIELDFYPGTKYQYATINYDVLALVVEAVTNYDFEEYVQNNIIKELGLTNTYIGRENVPSDKSVCPGYKRIFFQSREYDAPAYRGNNAAGYVISCASDMAKWIRCQLGQEKINEQLKRLIQKSHIGDDTVDSNDGSRYAAGWQVHIRGENYLHGGANPNYSSMLIIEPEEEFGVCVLTDMNSNAAEYIAGLIVASHDGKEYDDYEADMYLQSDNFFSIMCIMGVLLSVFYLVLILWVVLELFAGKRAYEKLEDTKVVGFISSFLIIVFGLFTLYYLPNILMSRLPWSAVTVWASPMIEYGCISIGIGGSLLIIYAYLSITFPKRREKNYFALIPLSIVNGIGSAFIILIINESFNRNLEYSKELLVCFFFALLIFIYTMKIVQGKLIILTHNLVYEKRVKIIQKIVQSSYEVIEKIGQEKIYVCLNNDVAAVANIPGVIVRFASDVLTLFFCFGYLYSKNAYSFAASISVIIINTIISFAISKISAKYWEKTRDIQEIFVNQISDLIYGFKEIVLNQKRRKEVEDELYDNAGNSAKLSKAAEIKKLGFNMYNSFVYNFVFGVVVFIFPLMLDLDVNELRENLLIIFYMIGPFGGITYEISEIMQFRVNLKRVNAMIDELDKNVQKENRELIESKKIVTCSESIEFSNVEYTYANVENDEYCFTLGPINIKINSGEINFIIGGNGSGKSTLAKLLTGLYTPTNGDIRIDGVKKSSSELNEYYSAIFSDFHLFKKLYGVDYERNKELLKKILVRMKIDKKINIDDDGCISNISLSTGQKKRLAYSILSLEDKPIVLFDEWAAEQDPEFREFFYSELLFDLKKQGKCVIVITHDDRYFGCADNVIKLDEGKIVAYQ